MNLLSSAAGMTDHNGIERLSIRDESFLLRIVERFLQLPSRDDPAREARLVVVVDKVVRAYPQQGKTETLTKHVLLCIPRGLLGCRMHRAVEFYCEERFVRLISNQKIKVRLQGERIKLLRDATAVYWQNIGKTHLDMNVVTVRRGDLLKLAVGFFFRPV